MDLVTVYRTFNAADAQLVRSRLDAAGIEADVVNENAALDLGVGAGNILVQVPDTSVEDARALITAIDRSSDSSPGGTDPA